jgi:hypothetical protein
LRQPRSAYALWRNGAAELAFEQVQAVGAFRDRPAESDRPRAQNVEVAYSPTETWQIAARLERSSDRPARRYGFAFARRVHDVATVTVEYLRSNFKRGSAFDNNGGELHRGTLVAAQLGLTF